MDVAESDFLQIRKCRGISVRSKRLIDLIVLQILIEISIVGYNTILKFIEIKVFEMSMGNEI